MIVRKAKVNHDVYGNGVVESVNVHSKSAYVDFNGKLKVLKLENLKKGHKNEYIEPKTTTQVINEINEMIDKYSRNDVAVAVLNELKSKL